MLFCEKEVVNKLLKIEIMHQPSEKIKALNTLEKIKFK
jgi:hypothetical protein